MSGESCRVSALNEKSSEPSAEGESERAACDSAEDTEELREYKDFRIGREERGSGNRFEKCSDEATVTTKFLSSGAKIRIVPTIKAKDLNSNQSSTRNQAQTGNDAEEREEVASGDSGRLKRGWTFKSQMIYIVDCIFASVIVGPVVIAHWRTLWTIMDDLKDIFTGWSCFAVGMSMHLLFALLRQPLHEIFATSIKSRGLFFRLGCRVIRTLYTYAFSLACNCHWRGAWILLSDWFGLQAGVIVCFTCAILGDLLVLRCLRNLLAPPFLVTVDSPNFVFRFPTRYRAVSMLQIPIMRT